MISAGVRSLLNILMKGPYLPAAGCAEEVACGDLWLWRMREASLCCVQLKCALQKRGERDASRVHSGGVNAALVSRDGRLAVTLSKDCTARVWDLETGTCRHVLVGGRRFCIKPRQAVTWTSSSGHSAMSAVLGIRHLGAGK